MNRTDLAYDYVCEQLISGKYKPGDLINVADLAADLNISRQPVLSALRRLGTEDMVQIIPQVGCIAASYSHEEWHDFHRLFASGEGLIGEIATERGTDEEVRQLRRLETAIKRLDSSKLSNTERGQRYREEVAAFYEHLHAMARSPILDRQLHAMWNRATYHFHAVAAGRMQTDRLIEAIGRFDAICDAIEARRARTAARLIETHILKQFDASERLYEANNHQPRKIPATPKRR